MKNFKFAVVAGTIALAGITTEAVAQAPAAAEIKQIAATAEEAYLYSFPLGSKHLRSFYEAVKVAS